NGCRETTPISPASACPPHRRHTTSSIMTPPTCPVSVYRPHHVPPGRSAPSPRRRFCPPGRPAGARPRPSLTSWPARAATPTSGTAARPGSTRLADVLRWQLHTAWVVIQRTLSGLTDDEYFWEPVPGCWSVRRRAEARVGLGQLRVPGGDPPLRRDRRAAGPLPRAPGALATPRHDDVPPAGPLGRGPLHRARSPPGRAHRA